MRKIKRNEPCPCGSGEKFKYCCGSSDVNTFHFHSDATNDTLYQLHQDLISFAVNTHKKAINQQAELYADPSLDEGSKDVYTTGLTPWIVPHTKSLENNQTIFGEFCRKEGRTWTPSVKNMLATWANAAPSVYEVISVDEPVKHFVQIRELLTGRDFHIPYQNADDFLEGSLLIGILIPFIGHHNFLITMVKLYNRDKDAYIQLLQQYAKENALTQRFPEFLTKALMIGTEANQWQRPEHEQVAELFAQHMVDKDMNDKMILQGVSLWQNYCTKKNPSIKKIEPYAAALDYLVQTSAVAEPPVKQTKLAEEYQTSAATISNIYRKLIEEIQQGDSN